jgi:hypothetical protein
MRKRLAHSINALAYTIENNIVFVEGHYKPNTAVGRRLLAHELTHVVQQEQAGHSTHADTPTGAQTSRGANVVWRQPREKMRDPEHEKQSTRKEALNGGREIEINRRLDLYTGPVELRPGSVGILTYERSVWIKTAEGHEATLRVRGSLHLYPPFNPAVSDAE